MKVSDSYSQKYTFQSAFSFLFELVPNWEVSLTYSLPLNSAFYFILKMSGFWWARWGRVPSMLLCLPSFVCSFTETTDTGPS